MQIFILKRGEMLHKELLFLLVSASTRMGWERLSDFMGFPHNSWKTYYILEKESFVLWSADNKGLKTLHDNGKFTISYLRRKIGPTFGNVNDWNTEMMPLSEVLVEKRNSCFHGHYIKSVSKLIMLKWTKPTHLIKGKSHMGK